jgi:hypothetical protein
VIDEIGAIFSPLWTDVDSDQTFPSKRPLLAHYTSLDTLERILVSNEMWFSNPLYMNDWEELIFGITEGAAAFRVHKGIRLACGDDSRYAILLEAFEKQLREFDQVHAFDTYIICFCEHDETDTDGILSMWRGYGDNGRGAAVVIDTSKLNAVPESPFIISRVVYGSRKQRVDWIEEKLTQFTDLLKNASVPNDYLWVAAWVILERLKIFSIFTKHSGFREEREWRFVYLRQRDRSNTFLPMLGYAIGKRGLEPKLKLTVAPFAGLAADLSLEKLINRIILGPSTSNVFSMQTVIRMLEVLGRNSLTGRISTSSTPFRPV